MINGLISSSKEDALKGALNQDNNSNGICKDSNNNVLCNLYEFSVRNTSSVTLDVDFYLYQQINGYSNLKYMGNKWNTFSSALTSGGTFKYFINSLDQRVNSSDGSLYVE